MSTVTVLFIVEVALGFALLRWLLARSPLPQRTPPPPPPTERRAEELPGPEEAPWPARTNSCTAG